tara:strand:+ start:1062 stop:1595 length:534 start_codon:yes stop_codon:yes gene_type:complete
MNKISYFNFSKQEIVPIILILLLAISRLIPHPPNFTPVIAVAIMSGIFFKRFYFSLTILFFAMLLSDFFIGFHKNMFFVYFSLFIINYFFSNFIININYRNLLFYSLSGSIIFFIFSNFGVWILGNLYPNNLEGLVKCYILAIPFFKNTLLSTLLFTYVLYFSNIYFKRIIFDKKHP